MRFGYGAGATVAHLPDGALTEFVGGWLSIFLSLRSVRTDEVSGRAVSTWALARREDE